LCTAYSHAQEHGSAAEKSVAFRNLAKVAGGAANVPSYCAGIAHPGAPQTAAHQHEPNPAGKPPHP
jgi:hypothetical protein